MKFSYIRSVRSSQIGAPVVWIIPSFTDHVPGAQLMLNQPVRSRPLNSGVNAGSWARATADDQQTARRQQHDSDGSSSAS